jgi:hypothetical protein
VGDGSDSPVTSKFPLGIPRVSLLTLADHYRNECCCKTSLKGSIEKKEEKQRRRTNRTEIK